MSWNYRIIKQDDLAETLAIHEVYYTPEGEPWGMTEVPIRVTGDSQDEIIRSLGLMLSDAIKHPIFVPPEQWATLQEEDEEDSFLTEEETASIFNEIESYDRLKDYKDS